MAAIRIKDFVKTGWNVEEDDQGPASEGEAGEKKRSEKVQETYFRIL